MLESRQLPSWRRLLTLHMTARNLPPLQAYSSGGGGGGLFQMVQATKSKLRERLMAVVKWRARLRDALGSVPYDATVQELESIASAGASLRTSLPEAKASRAIAKAARRWQRRAAKALAQCEAAARAMTVRDAALAERQAMRDIETRELRAELEEAGQVGAVGAGELEVQPEQDIEGLAADGKSSTQGGSGSAAAVGSKRGRGWEEDGKVAKGGGQGSAKVMLAPEFAATGRSRRKRRRTSRRRIADEDEDDEEDENGSTGGSASGSKKKKAKPSTKAKRPASKTGSGGGQAMQDDGDAGEDGDEDDEDEDDVADPEAPAPRISVGMLRRILQEGEHLPVAFPERARLNERVEFVDRLSKRIKEHLPNMPGHPRGVSGNRLP